MHKNINWNYPTQIVQMHASQTCVHVRNFYLLDSGRREVLFFQNICPRSFVIVVGSKNYFSLPAGGELVIDLPTAGDDCDYVAVYMLDSQASYLLDRRPGSLSSSYIDDEEPSHDDVWDHVVLLNILKDVC